MGLKKIKISCKVDSLLPIEDLNNFQGDLKTIEPEAFEKLKNSILKYGFSFPIFVWNDNILDGHQRLKAAKALMGNGYYFEGDALPVVWIEAKNEKEAAEKLLLINSRYAKIDQSGFDLFVENFDIDIADLSDMLDIPEVDFSIEDEGEFEGNTDPDDVPEVEETPVTKMGDIWLLGDHRLCCGDSTKIEDVERLMDGNKAAACITDPPYSVNYEESHKIRGGNKKVHSAYHEADINPTDILGFIEYLPTDVLLLSYSVNRHIFILSERLKYFKFEVRKELVWVKDTFSFWMGAAYQQKHEPIWICTRNNAGFSKNVDSKDSTVLEYKRPKSHELHPTAKPIELWTKLVKNHTDIDELLYEPFSGSGTTIIAAQQTGRKCYAIEISPQYVDVAIKRWQDYTGKDAVLESTGQTFTEVSEINCKRCI